MKMDCPCISVLYPTVQSSKSTLIIEAKVILGAGCVVDAVICLFIVYLDYVDNIIRCP